MECMSGSPYAVEAISVTVTVNAFARRPTSLRVVAVKDFRDAIVGCQGIKDRRANEGPWRQESGWSDAPGKNTGA